MKKIAIVFASRHGQTSKIAHYMENKLQEQGFSTQLIDAAGPDTHLHSEADGVIYGSPVYRGKFESSVLRWVKNHKANLRRMPSALFTVALNAADQRPSARAADDGLLCSFMTQTSWVPSYVASFAGALKYREYFWPIRLLMKRISREAGGSTDTSRNHEYTSWAQVDSFVATFARQGDTPEFLTAKRFPQERAAVEAQLRGLGELRP